MSEEKTQKKKWRKVVGILLFVLLNAIIILITAISEFGNSKEAAELSEVRLNGWLLLPATLFFIIATLANVYKYVLMMKKSYPEDNRPKTKEIWKIAWRVVMLGKYYDNVTPAAVGGQPFQIYYMRKASGLSRGKTSSIPIVGMIAGQIGFLAIALCCFLFGGILDENPALFVTAWLGLLFFAFWPIMVAGVSFFPKATTRFLKLMIKILAKLRIIKNRKKAFEKVEDEMDEYANSVKMITRTKGLLAKVIILAIIYNIFTMMIPFFVLRAFGGNVGFVECFALTVAVTSAVYFVPTPGNSGAAEGTFFLVFSALSSGYVFWAMLVWRFFAYYIYILVGWLIYLRMHFEKKRAKIKR